MNKAIITLSVLASLGAAAAVTSFTSEAVSAEEIGSGQKANQPVVRPVKDDCASQVWPNFSQSCLSGRVTQVTVRNVNPSASDRR